MPSLHFHSTLKPLEQPPDLFALMPLCGVNDFKGSLGAVHFCPVCRGLVSETPPTENDRSIESLRIHVNSHNEVVLRCYCCGLAESALGLAKRQSELTWSNISEVLAEHRVFGDQPVPQDWIERAKAWEKFSMMFERSKAFFRRFSRNGDEMDVPFGEIGISHARELERTLPGIMLVSRWGKMTQFFVELRRSVLGLPTQVLIRHRRKEKAVASFALQPPDPVDLWIPEWALCRDWSHGLILFSDLGMAGDVMQVLTQHPAGIEPPAAWVADCRGQVLDEIPSRSTQYLPSEKEGPELGLAFVQPGLASLVNNHDAVEQVADYIIERTKDADPVAYLHTVLQKPWITPFVEERLTRAVCSRLGEGAADLIARSGASDRILPCRIGNTTYLCRRGIYLKRRGKKELQPCTNFSLRVEHTVVRGEEPLHQVLLIMEVGTARFTVTEDRLQDGKTLLQQAVAAANTGALKDLPRVFDHADVKRLPQIVLATQLKPAIFVESPPTLGFDWGQFHGPNFTSTVHGVDFRASTMEPVTSMLPEEEWTGTAAHLSYRANELATTMSEMEPAPRALMAVMLNAALDWLLRASQGQRSYLLLPSEAHLEVLASLIGVVPIDVGRSKGENPSAPRIMRSKYSKIQDFRRQGHLVAALEDRCSRVDPQIPIVVKQWKGGDPPKPTAILSLLTHCVLGADNLAQARQRLVSLIGSDHIGTPFLYGLEHGASFMAGPYDYLEVFLAAVKKLPRANYYLIKKPDKTLLRRSVVQQLREQRGYDFRETRLIEELRYRYNYKQPARYGRKGEPVFRLPRERTALDSHWRDVI